MSLKKPGQSPDGSSTPSKKSQNKPATDVSPKDQEPKAPGSSAVKSSKKRKHSGSPSSTPSNKRRSTGTMAASVESRRSVGSGPHNFMLPKTFRYSTGTGMVRINPSEKNRNTPTRKIDFGPKVEFAPAVAQVETQDEFWNDKDAAYLTETREKEITLWRRAMALYAGKTPYDLLPGGAIYGFTNGRTIDGRAPTNLSDVLCDAFMLVLHLPVFCIAHDSLRYAIQLAIFHRHFLAGYTLVKPKKPRSVLNSAVFDFLNRLRYSVESLGFPSSCPDILRKDMLAIVHAWDHHIQENPDCGLKPSSVYLEAELSPEDRKSNRQCTTSIILEKKKQWIVGRRKFLKEKKARQQVRSERNGLQNSRQESDEHTSSGYGGGGGSGCEDDTGYGERDEVVDEDMDVLENDQARIRYSGEQSEHNIIVIFDDDVEVVAKEEEDQESATPTHSDTEMEDIVPLYMAEGGRITFAGGLVNAEKEKDVSNDGGVPMEVSESTEMCTRTEYEADIQVLRDFVARRALGYMF